MKAAVRDRYGTPDVVRVEEIPRPDPKGDQLLVRVRAASVNRADLDGIEPRPSFTRLFLGLRAPRNRRLGIDVAGIVEAVGPDVTRFQVGDAVFADLFSHGQGSFAEFVCAREKAFLPIPAGMSFEDASTLPHSAILAIQSLRTQRGRVVQPGERVLVDGAGGNVGPFAVQIASARGAEVTAVDHTDKLEFLRSIGADHVIDYTATDYTTTGERYDWILDTDSHHPLFDARRALRHGGRYVTLGGTARRIGAALLVGPVITLATGRSMGLMLGWRPFAGADIATLSDLVLSGQVRPAIERRYRLDDVAEALRHVFEGRAKGKVVIVLDATEAGDDGVPADEPPAE